MSSGSSIAADWPHDASGAPVSGLVIVRATVSQDGRVVRAVVDSSSGYPALDDKALSTVWKWQFHPWYKDGVAVEGVVRVPVRLDPPRPEER
ncbi:energy transducer TonB [Dyella sp. C9]|uniref:energy transducer TonB n=1 Tax=Dyella sp. C9 TaxID=2202154 RepID=UPI0034E0654A